VEPTVIEMNLETVHRLRGEGVPAVYGDAGHLDTLKAAGVERAASILLSASGLRNAAEIIRLARELNPRIRALVRCAYLRELPALRRAGANGVFSGEGEVALAMAESILRELGAVPDQIDRERERVRADLFSEPTPPEAGGSRDHPPAGVSGSSAVPARNEPVAPE
jgi:CPA2 family monovalent cation:H+ antiporter-2